MIHAVGGYVDESGRETRNHELILVGAELWILVEPLQSCVYFFVHWKAPNQQDTYQDERSAQKLPGCVVWGDSAEHPGSPEG